MKNSTHIFTLLFSCASIFVISFSCESHDESVDSAFDNLREDRLASTDSGAPYQPFVDKRVDKNDKPSNEFENLDGWNKFKTAFEKSADTNAKQVKIMKTIAGLSVENYRKVTKLEKENNDLLTQVNDFADNDAVETAKFWTEMEKKMSDVTTALDELNTKIKAGGLE